MDRDRLILELRQNLRGDVLDDHLDRRRYACDESIYSQIPSVVVAPDGEADLQVVVAIAQFFSIPITARGGGTSVAGQSIGPGIVLDFAPHFQTIEDIGPKTAVVQPGVTLSRLNRELAKVGRRIAPDPESRSLCTVGGMVGTNAAGPRSLLHGTTRDYVRRLRVVLADGAVMESSRLTDRFPTLHEYLSSQEARILSWRPRTRKNSSGYALEELCGKRPDYARFLTGTEGTLVLTSEVELWTIPHPMSSSLAIFGFRSLEEAAHRVAEYRTFHPAAIQLLDRNMLEALKKSSPAILSALNLDESEASLWMEWEGPVPEGVDLEKGVVLEDPQGSSNLWALLSKAYKRLHVRKGSAVPIRCIEDGIVPPEKLVEFVRGVKEILRSNGCEGAIYGPAGDAHLHVYPWVDVSAPHLPQRIDRLMEETFGLIWELGGSISAQHGDGVLRRRHAERQWKELLPLFHRVKEVFDPAGIFNPEKKFSLDGALLPPYRSFDTGETDLQHPVDRSERPLTHFVREDDSMRVGLERSQDTL